MAFNKGKIARMNRAAKLASSRKKTLKQVPRAKMAGSIRAKGKTKYPKVKK